MRRIFVAMLLGAALFSFLYGHDSATKRTAAADTLIAAKAPIDSLSKNGPDAVAAHKHMTALHTLNASDSTAVQKNTSSQKTQTKELPSPELKNLSETEGSLDPNGYKDTHWGM